MTEVILFFGVPCQHNVELVRAYANERGAEFINLAAIMKKLPSGALSRHMRARDLIAHRVAARTEDSPVVVAFALTIMRKELTSFLGAALRKLDDRRGVTLVFLETYCDLLMRVNPRTAEELNPEMLGHDTTAHGDACQKTGTRKWADVPDVQRSLATGSRATLLPFYDMLQV